MILNLFETAQRHARLLLVAGLLAGLTLPALAAVIKDALPGLVALLLCLSAVRVGAKATLGNLKDLHGTAGALLILQLVLPLAALGAVLVLGLEDQPLAFALLLMLSAPSITGAQNFTSLMGHNPAPPMRLLILGTAVFPASALIALWGLPGLEGSGGAALAALRLAIVIAAGVGLGFALRRIFLPAPSTAQTRALDGASAILLAIMVVGLMAALGPALRANPSEVAIWLVVASAANFGLQVAAHRLGAGPGTSIVAGNRNIALYLVALPASVTDPLLIFIGCYQIPMYLTPVVMQRFYGRTAA